MRPWQFVSSSALHPRGRVARALAPAFAWACLGVALSVAPSHAQFLNAVYSRDALDVVAVADSGSLYRSASGRAAGRGAGRGGGGAGVGGRGVQEGGRGRQRAERGRGEQLELPAARAAGADLGPVLRGAERVGGEQLVAGCDADDRRWGIV